MLGGPKKAHSELRPGLLVLETDHPVEGLAVGRFYAMSPEGLTVGRAADSLIMVRGPGIGYRHLQLEQRDGRFLVIPTGTGALVAIDGKTLRSRDHPVAIEDGQILQVGPIRFLFVERYPDAWL
ncbi:MAG: FHA domain-containing protein [Deltaproteobacteria bacterium]|nr:FHA domain-containing protein [Deltaproteobacteria bacterium]